HLTSTTGIDALTHAVEAYLGKSNTKETKKCAEEAIVLIFKYLEKAYNDGQNIEAREKMLLASYYAGIAFTRAYVGNVHAMAHTFGGFYQVPHGLANAVILPYVLKYYNNKAVKKLAKLAELVGIGNPNDLDSQKAEAFIEAIKSMNKRMNIPDKITIPNLDNLTEMVNRAFHEANPLYPVPMIFNKKDFDDLFKQVIILEGEKQ
ncbi:MAG: iron-containing alcohol dehydrogenase, partial [Bacilli bacterium]